ncbi:hypothetical protein LCGC14_1464840 [marine sediment metagenome]|uniref:Uncharacterized protein n=1 Tax=marine sediment metagenome TaxID=412755 RepID=A0A0F9JE22_9ZZZZ
MAVATGPEKKLSNRQKIEIHDFDPGVTTVVAVGWRPIRGFRTFLARLMRTVGTAATTFDIAVATDSSGTSAAAVITHAVGSEPDAVGDELFLECSVENMRETLATSTHWSARISLATDTDEMVVTTIEADPQHPRTGLTADIVA